MRTELQVDSRNACPGDTIMLTAGNPWPSPIRPDVPELRERVPTAPPRPTVRAVTFVARNGTRLPGEEPLLTSDRTLSVKVPAQAIGGPIHVEFEPGFSTTDGFQFSAPFDGGISEILSFGPIQTRHDRCLIPGETLSLRWTTNNLRDLRLQWTYYELDEGSPPPLHAGSTALPDGESPPTLTVPTTAVPLICVVTLTGTAVCNKRPRRYGVYSDKRQASRTWMVEPATPGPTRVLPPIREDEFDNYYHSAPLRTRAARVHDPEGVAAVMRHAAASDNRVGVISTGGSYEPITGPGSGSADALLCVDPWPTLAGAGVASGDIAAHNAYVKRAAAEISSRSKELRKSLDRNTARSVLSERAKQLYEPAIKAFQASEGAPVRGLSHVVDRLVYVEAATKLFDLHRMLQRMNLMVPTLGASGFQSLAGAVATSTHGSTVHLPPLADFVRAIHLIGPGGVHWWIDRGDISRGRREALNRHYVDKLELHLRPEVIYDSMVPRSSIPASLFARAPTIRFLGNDDFEAALVSAGALGHVYAYVLETVDLHKMHQATYADGDWSTLRPALAGVMELLDNSGHPISGARSTRWHTGTSKPDAADVPWFVHATIGSHGNGILDVRALGDDPGPTGRISGGASGTSETLETLLEPTLEKIGKVLADDDSERAARVFASILRDLWKVSVLGTHAFDYIHDELAAGQLPRKKPGIAPYVLSKEGRGFHRWGDEHHWPETDEEAERALELPGVTAQMIANIIRHFAISHEYAFPAPVALEFCDEALKVGKALRKKDDAIAFQLNIRLTRQTRAALGMQQWDLTGHVEIFSFPGLSANGALYSRLDELAKSFGGVPHWGQKHPDGLDYARSFPRGPEFRRLFQTIDAPQGRSLDTFRDSFTAARLIPGVWSDVDAALVSPTNGKAYFFKGGRYQRFDFATEKVDATRTIGVDGWG